MTKENHPLARDQSQGQAGGDQVRVWFDVKDEDKDKELGILLSLEDADDLKRYLKKQLGLDKKEDG